MEGLLNGKVISSLEGEEIYQILTTSHQGRYTIDVHDTSPQDATITEMITLPKIPERQTYPFTLIHLTPEQLEGYLFLSQFGEVGSDPLGRSALIAHSCLKQRTSRL